MIQGINIHGYTFIFLYKSCLITWLGKWIVHYKWNNLLTNDYRNFIFCSVIGIIGTLLYTHLYVSIITNACTYSYWSIKRKLVTALSFNSTLSFYFFVFKKFLFESTLCYIFIWNFQKTKQRLHYLASCPRVLWKQNINNIQIIVNN